MRKPIWWSVYIFITFCTLKTSFGNDWEKIYFLEKYWGTLQMFGVVI